MVLLVLGILFIILGLIAVLEGKYTIFFENNERYIKKETNKRDDNFNKYKNVLGLLSLILGVLCILNYIIY